MPQCKRFLREWTAWVGALSLMTAPIGSPIAYAQNVLPQGGAVVSGSAAISQPSVSSLSINQSSARAIINWNSFSVGAPNSVNFYQPSSSSAALNRVLGSTPSTIAGQLNANGQIFLVNPNGIAITPSGTVTVGGGFVASTLDIANGDFMAGNLIFKGSGSSAGVSNQGTIRTDPGGFVGLFGGTVSNAGTITVPLGKVGLGSGEQVTLDLHGDGFLQVALPTNATANGRSLIEVAGKIRAKGGRIELSAATVAMAIRNAVNVSGSLSATSISGRDGAIVLGGGTGGNVEITGSVNASGDNRAGSITITGVNVALSGAKLETRSLQGMGGRMIITAADTVAISNSQLNASGGTGGGAIRIGGDFQGLGTIGWAAKTIVDASSTIQSDALLSGPGGTVVLWSGQLTTFAGQMSAQGGLQGGNGGMVEVSSKGVLDYRGLTNLSAVKGSFGTLLLDPYNIEISANPDSGLVQVGHCCATLLVSASDTSVLNVSTLIAQLELSNVILQTGSTGSPGSQQGNITINAPISWTSGSILNLLANNNVVINQPVTPTNNFGTVDVQAGGTVQGSNLISDGHFFLDLCTGNNCGGETFGQSMGAVSGNEGISPSANSLPNTNVVSNTTNSNTINYNVVAYNIGVSNPSSSNGSSSSSSCSGSSISQNLNKSGSAAIFGGSGSGCK